MTDEVAIKVENVSKSFKLPHEKMGSIKGAIVNFWKRNKGYENQHVLKGIDFEIKKGDFFGIVGRNGSGKSTLLKIISQIYSPDKGKVTINGKLVPFIELGVGFNPELTGKENVYLNGALLGFSREETESMYDDIVRFAELEKFMDQKLKNYSSGMQVRLAFSIAIQADGDILLLDEVLAVGDEAFQRKCNDYFEQLKERKKTVILVTHSMESVRKYCNKAIMLRNGEVVLQGSPEDVSNEYSLENLNTKGASLDDAQDESSPVKDLKVKLLSGERISQGDKIEVKIDYKVPSRIPTRAVISIQDLDRNVPVFASDAPLTEETTVSKRISLEVDSINDSNLRVSVSVRDKDYNILQFLPESKAPSFALHRTDYKDSAKKTTWAMLFSRGEWK